MLQCPSAPARSNFCSWAQSRSIHGRSGQISISLGYNTQIQKTLGDPGESTPLSSRLLETLEFWCLALLGNARYTGTPSSATSDR